MTMPGFTAEASLYMTSEQYWQASSFEPGDMIVPQTILPHCDLECLGDCLDGMPDCWELPPGANCGAIQRAYRAMCRRECCH